MRRMVESLVNSRFSMRIVCFIVGVLVMVAPMAPYAAVSVRSEDPDRFTDIADRNTDPRNAMEDIAQHLQALGERYLAAGADLTIRVLDVNRAGRPWRDLPTKLRVVDGRGDLPCIELEWSLKTGADASPPRRERVCDPEFLRPVRMGYSEHDPLVYEKRMLEEWFRSRFAPGPRAGRR